MKNAGANKRLNKIVDAGKSQRAFSRRSGISHVLIGRIIAGGKITYRMAKRLEAATGIAWDRWCQE